MHRLVNRETIMSFNTVDCGTFDCFSPITGSALTIPKGFWLPGSAAIYQGYFGTTSILNYAMGTCNVGMSPTARLHILVLLVC